MNNISFVRREVIRPWWYRTFRTVSAFCYRYWWLIWIVFIAYLIFWYLLCFRMSISNCNHFSQFNKDIASIYQHLDNCCNCSTPLPNQSQTPPNIKPCDYDESISGGKGYVETIHNLGETPGMVNIDYNMLNIPDKMEVYYDGQLVASTDKLISGIGSLSFYYPAQPGKPTFCKVVLTAPKDGTSWGYHIGCPR